MLQNMGCLLKAKKRHKRQQCEGGDLSLSWDTEQENEYGRKDDCNRALMGGVGHFWQTSAWKPKLLVSGGQQEWQCRMVVSIVHHVGR